MSTEAHKLIGISLSKIAQSRASRSGVSLHKNLLVATVLHKARYIFMEEAYQIVHGNNKGFTSGDFNFKFNNPSTNLDQADNSTSEHFENSAKEPMEDESVTTDEKLLNDMEDGEWRSGEDRVKTATGDRGDSDASPPPTYKNPPTSYQAHIELTYLNLDKYNNSNESKTETPVQSNNSANSLKRRHSEWEVEEAVLSILPKRSKSYSSLDVASASSPAYEQTPSEHDFTFLDDSDFLSESSSNASSPTSSTTNNSTKVNYENEEKLVGPSMEIDRLSSLVSIFSFANLSEVSGICEDNDSIKSITPDQCSAQAKDNSDVLQPVPSFLAMTV